MKKEKKKPTTVYNDLTPHERDWIIANEKEWGLSDMARMSGIPVSTIKFFLAVVGRDNCARIREKRNLIPVSYAEAKKMGRLPVFRNTKLANLWTEHTIEEIAKILDKSFPSVVYDARKANLTFSEEKLDEIERKDAARKANRLKNHVRPSAEEPWRSKSKTGYDVATSGTAHS